MHRPQKNLYTIYLIGKLWTNIPYDSNLAHGYMDKHTPKIKINALQQYNKSIIRLISLIK